MHESGKGCGVRSGVDLISEFEMCHTANYGVGTCVDRHSFVNDHVHDLG